MTPAPQQRHPALQPLSREHHAALMVCFQVRKGLNTGISAERLGAYLQWFITHQLEPHFRYEEELVLPLLPNGHALRAQTLEEHAALRAGGLQKDWAAEELLVFADRLDRHIRFEERVLFPYLQEHAGGSVLEEALRVAPQTPACPVWEDAFWLTFKP